MQRYNCHPPGELRQIEKVTAFLLVRRNTQHTSINLLWTIACAPADNVWQTSPDHTKQQLRRTAEFE